MSYIWIVPMQGPSHTLVKIRTDLNRKIAFRSYHRNYGNDMVAALT